MKRKYFVIAILVIVLLVSLVSIQGCGKKKTDEVKPPKKTEVTKPEDQAEKRHRQHSRQFLQKKFHPTKLNCMNFKLLPARVMQISSQRRTSLRSTDTKPKLRLPRKTVSFFIVCVLKVFTQRPMQMNWENNLKESSLQLTITG